MSSRRELENYLLAPTAIARYLSTKIGREVSPTDVESMINEAADSLLEIAAERRVLWRVSKPIFPNRTQSLTEVMVTS